MEKLQCKLGRKSKELAKSKDLINFFGQSVTFNVSAEAILAEEQTARNTLTDGNEEAAEKTAASSPNSFYRQCLKKKLSCQIKYWPLQYIRLKRSKLRICDIEWLIGGFSLLFIFI